MGICNLCTEKKLYGRIIWQFLCSKNCFKLPTHQWATSDKMHNCTMHIFYVVSAFHIKILQKHRKAFETLMRILCNLKQSNYANLQKNILHRQICHFHWHFALLWAVLYRLPSEQSNQDVCPNFIRYKL